MTESLKTNLQTFHFRNLHPQVLIGTASDRYAGWLGQIYSPERYHGRITPRTKIIGGQAFTEEVLPVESVEEYFDHSPRYGLHIRPWLNGSGRDQMVFDYLPTDFGQGEPEFQK